MTSCTIKPALFNSKLNYFIHVRIALFHSSPVLDGKRRTNHSWESFNPYDLNESSSSGGPSWFTKQYSARSRKKKWAGNQGASSWGRRNFDFCEDYVDIETILRSKFGNRESFYWSFVNEDDSQRMSSSKYSNHSGNSRSWKHRNEERYESDSDNSKSDERSALGLSNAGPLKLEDVKNVYRICAMKWHPDRHQGSSKAAAEEKFKHCSAAYQSLCDKLAVN